MSKDAYPETNMTKTCTKCLETKPRDQFHKKSDSPDRLNNSCKRCVSTRNRQRYQDNREERITRQKAYYKSNTDRVAAYQKQYRQANREKIAARDKKWQQANPEKAVSRTKKWRMANREKVATRARERTARYSLRSDSEIQVHQARLRPLGTKRCHKCRESQTLDSYYSDRGKPDGLGKICKSCRVPALKKKANFKSRNLTRCVYCLGPYEHIDHVMPRFLGGTEVASNLVPSCSKCNLSKGSMHPSTWLGRIRPGEDHLVLLASWGIDWREWPVEVNYVRQ